MTEFDSALDVIWARSISLFTREEWDKLALPQTSPFLEWDWLRLAEESGSASPRTGWIPHHLGIRRGGRLIAAAPLYLKMNSRGEFVFDHVWAEVAGKLGAPFYPKLVGMSPFTPADGYKFMISDREDEQVLSRTMAGLIDRFCMENGMGGSNFHFVDPLWQKSMKKNGWVSWMHPGFAWYNRDFETFDDFLLLFNSNQRKNIRKERNSPAKEGVELHIHLGSDASDNLYELMFHLYARHNDQFGPWGCKFLTQEFFHGLKQAFGRRILFVAASPSGKPENPFAMAMLVHKNDRLFGRYWGTTQRIRNLHFNVCYYEPIAWAIENQILRFDPGMGGRHKARRGFTAEPNYSLHRFCDMRMRAVMNAHMDMINELEQEEIENLNAELPFKRTG
ncbi:MAG: GNAT family N-acetyltransferase [Desulfovibrionales bacterium]